MAFDFPDSPAVGDEYVSGGCKYTWTGTVWDLSGMDAALDYVETTGDTMTGDLNVMAPASFVGMGTTPEMGTAKLQGGSTDRTGLVGFFKPKAVAADPEVRLARLGWGTATEIEFKFENGCTGMKMDGGRLAFVNFAQPAGSEHLLTRHIDMYGGTFGFSISSGTLNHVVPATNIHAFKCGTETVVDIRSDGMRIPGGNLNVTGTIQAGGLITSSVTQGNNAIQLNDGARINLSNGCLIYKNYGSNDFMFHTNASQVFTFHISGTGDVFVIDTVGSTGNSVNVTAPESLKIGKELGVACDAERGVDLMKVIAALLVKIKKLEARK